MNKILSFVKVLNPTDIVIILFYLLLTLINILFHHKIDETIILLLINVIVVFSVIQIAKLDYKKDSSFTTQLHTWYLIPIIFITFKELYVIMQSIHSSDCDNFLISIDRFLFGTDPTHFLLSYSTPLLTEILQIAYHMFYFIPIIAGVELIRRKNKKNLQFFLFAIVYGFILSYIGYILVPAVGPRFTLHNFATINTELPGIYITNFLRGWVNMGESIFPSTINPIEVVQRDVFPSGHTQITLIIVYLSYKYKLKSRKFLTSVGLLLIIATVYLRYHYVIDVIAGIAFMIFTIWSGTYFCKVWKNFTVKLNKKNNE